MFSLFQSHDLIHGNVEASYINFPKGANVLVNEHFIGKKKGARAKQQK